MATTFSEAGFISDQMNINIKDVEQASSELFSLSREFNNILMTIITDIGESITPLSEFDQLSLSAKIVFRSTATMQSVILLSSRGMISDSQSLVRNLCENVFILAALRENSHQAIEFLEENYNNDIEKIKDSLLTNKTTTSSNDEDIDRNKKKYKKNKSIHSFSTIGEINEFYKIYSWLCHSAAHVTLSSLNVHRKQISETTWDFWYGPGDSKDISKTLSLMVLTIILVISISFDILKMNTEKYGIENLYKKYQAIKGYSPD